MKVRDQCQSLSYNFLTLDPASAKADMGKIENGNGACVKHQTDRRA